MLTIFSKKDKADLDKGLEKTRESLITRLARAIAGKSSVDDETLDAIESALLAADVGIGTTVEIIHKLAEQVARDKYTSTQQLFTILRGVIASMISQPAVPVPAAVPYVILVVGVNGAGKTTTCGKLAFRYRQAGKQVLLGAADTFRAAAIDQLAIWSERAGASLIRKEMGGDPGSVAFDAVSAAVARRADVVIIDTAGRLHNKVNLMNELGKIRRVISKVIPDAPHEVLLVLDASGGQNAMRQAKEFTQVTEVTGIVLTKLDGTAKGGMVISISEELGIPVRYIGVGEKIEQLQEFSRDRFIESLFR